MQVSTFVYLVAPQGTLEGIAIPSYPLVSFCIPTKNRERTIEACLKSIRSQTYPHMEIVVIDNGSTDRTMEIACKYADIVASCSGQLGAVRQYSIDMSHGQILALFDDDIIIPHTEWLMGAVAAFHLDSGASTVWPVLVPPPNASPVTRCFFDLNEAVFAHRRYRSGAVFGGGNSLFRRDAITNIGGFNPAIGFGEDFDLAKRLKAAGYRVIWHRDPLIHDSMYSLHEIYRKQLWGAAAVQTHGTELLAQSQGDMFREQVIVGLRAMFRGLVVHKKAYWMTYPLILGAKALPYSRALVERRLRRAPRDIVG